MARRMKRPEWKRLHYEFGTYDAVQRWRAARMAGLVSEGMLKADASRQADDECFMRFPPCKDGLREILPPHERKALEQAGLESLPVVGVVSGSESGLSIPDKIKENSVVSRETVVGVPRSGSVKPVIRDYADLAKAAEGREAPHHETVMWVLRHVLFPVSEIDPDTCPDPAAAFYLSMAQDTMGAVELMRTFSKYLGADTEEERLERRKDMARATMDEIERHLALGVPEVSEVVVDERCVKD